VLYRRTTAQKWLAAQEQSRPVASRGNPLHRALMKK
jgi:hypothetical protein